MAKTYEQIQAQIEKLQAQAEKLREREVDGVVGKIREAVKAYNLTPEMLFGPRAAKVASKRTVSASRKQKRKGKFGPIGKLYRHPETGAEWPGRGPRPMWLREAVAAGRNPDEFLV
ncbi:H-NS histone family protein [Variovorax sp. LjRoot178]|uniref:H-NS histone family protein n=1 Tax=Variovorax sp. LjRoot178 TaxID=3342277 RepID=UPI003ECC5392